LEAGSFFLGLKFLEKGIQAIELLVPLPAVVLGPIRNLLDGSRPKAAVVIPPLPPLDDQPRSLEIRDVLGHGLL
jgi:hypothetical protein